MTTLYQMKSQAQLRAALAAGDEQLVHDIRYELAWRQDKARRKAKISLGDLDEAALVEQAMDPLVIDQLIAGIDNYTGSRMGLVPREEVQEALGRHIGFAAGNFLELMEADRGSWSTDDGVLKFEVGHGTGPSVHPVSELRTVVLSDQMLWVPSEMVLRILNEIGPSDADWKHAGGGEYVSDWVGTGEFVQLDFNRDRIQEWVVDQRQTYLATMVDADPDHAIAEMMKHIGASFPELARKIRRAQLPKEILTSYAVAFFADPEHGLRVLNEATGEWGYEGTRAQTLLEIDKATLRKLGITQGKWWDGAPWKLLDLPADELAYEGTLMRHCVGRFDMPYRKRVSDGIDYIFSLRSQFNRPVLTFEVVRHEWDTGGGYQFALAGLRRALAIRQIKGKLNRRAAENEDEAKVLIYIFSTLGVDPKKVKPFVGHGWLLSDWRDPNPRRRAHEIESAKDRLLAFNPARPRRRR